MAIGGKLGETGSDGTVGNSGAEPGVVVLVVVGCVCLYVCVCVSGVCWLRRSVGTSGEGGRGGQLASLAPRECPSSRVCRDLGGFDGRGVARVRETTVSADSGAIPRSRVLPRVCRPLGPLWYRDW